MDRWRLRWGVPPALAPVAVCVFLLAVSATAVPTVASENDAARAAHRPRVLLLGDSWITFMTIFRSFDHALADMGLPADSITSLHYPGSEVREWNGLIGRMLIGSYLMSMPSIDSVVLCMGGNDVMERYNALAPEAERRAAIAEVEADLASMVGFVLSLRPNVRIAIVGYDYPNFRDALQYRTWPAQRRIYEQAGRPSPAQANEAVIGLAEAGFRIARGRGRVVYVHNTGLMQYRFGYSRAGLKPGVAPYPADTPEDGAFPGGDPSLPTPLEAMISFWDFRDAIHLGAAGSRAVAERVMDVCLRDWLDEPLAVSKGGSAP